MLILIIVLILLCGGIGSYRTWGNPNYGPTWGRGIGLSTILVILLIVYLLGGFSGIRFPH